MEGRDVLTQELRGDLVDVASVGGNLFGEILCCCWGGEEVCC